MEHTWESECLPKLELRNPTAGDVGVCSLWTLPGILNPHLDLPRISIVGPLRTRRGLGWLLRGLYLHPMIRNLVLCGSDPSMTGDVTWLIVRSGLEL